MEELRTEAAEARTKAKQAEALADRLKTLAGEHAAGPILRDPADLTWSDDFLESDGPTLNKIRAAAEALTVSKPYLAQVSGDVGQGQHTDQYEPLSLSALLRGVSCPPARLGPSLILSLRGLARQEKPSQVQHLGGSSMSFHVPAKQCLTHA